MAEPPKLMTPEEMRAFVRQSPIERLKAQTPAYTSNNTIGRCSIYDGPPPQRYWENGPTQAQKDAARKNANTIGIWGLGPIFGGPAALVRLLGGSEDAVEKAGELGASLPVGGPKGAKSTKQAMKKPSPGTVVLPPLRQKYVDKVKKLKEKEAQMRAEGKSSEEIARELHGDRRAIGEEFKDMTPQPLRDDIYARNLDKYGDKLGPSIDYLRGQGKSWDQIIDSASRTGGQDLGF